MKQAFLRIAATGPPPLLIVIDEAGNTPLRSVPQCASTLAGPACRRPEHHQKLSAPNLSRDDLAVDRTDRAGQPSQADTNLTKYVSTVFYSGLPGGMASTRAMSFL